MTLSNVSKEECIKRAKEILADEPTGALDSKTSEQVLEIISDIAKKGELVIMVTHSKRVADKCNRVVTVSDGT